jgi:23S rRNA (adenine2030-N6)-methyltransferase
MLKFSTGVYMIWIPQVARPEAHELPRKLRSIANKAGKPWLHALLQVRGTNLGAPGGGLAGSSVFVVNPTFGLRDALQDSLPYLVRTLGQDKKARFDLQSQGV